jgi:hypothetical protein
MPVLRGAGDDIETHLKTLWFIGHLKHFETQWLAKKNANFGYQISTA